MEARKLLPIGVAVTILVVLVGIASHGRPLRPGIGVGPSATFFDYVATTSLLLVIVLIVVVLYAVRMERTNKSRPRARFNLVTFLIMLVASALVAALLSNSTFEKRLRAAGQNVRPQSARRPPAHAGSTNVKNVRNARIRWDEIAVVLVLLGGIGVYLYVTRDARRSLRPLRQRRRIAVSRALDDSIDDLRREPDVRRAIVAAYARMETALAAAGVPRAAAETPYEYLERSLVDLDAGAEAARRLTDLFERAKFSHHEPAEAMRDEAIDALIAIRDDLRRPAGDPLVA